LKRSIPLLLVALAVLAGARSAAAQERGTFAVGLLGGIGGALDAEGDREDFDHQALEASFAMLTNDNTLVVARVGELELEDDLGAEGLFDARLRFATLAGEYRFRQPSYDYGIYLGLGGYELEGESFFGEDEDERSLGLAFGVTGDFDVSRHLSAVVEIAAHYAFFDRAEIYGAALGGIAVHF
jgi:hypothetical protein